MADFINENSCSNLTTLDLYDDLLTSEKVKEEESLNEVQQKLHDATVRIAELDGQLEKARKSEKFYQQRTKIMEKNISALYLTAKVELERKNAQISDLRRALEKASARHSVRSNRCMSHKTGYGDGSLGGRSNGYHAAELRSNGNTEKKNETKSPHTEIRKRKSSWIDTSSWIKKSKLENEKQDMKSSEIVSEGRYKPAPVHNHSERSRDGFDIAKKLVEKSKKDLLKRRSGESSISRRYTEEEPHKNKESRSRGSVDSRSRRSDRYSSSSRGRDVKSPKSENQSDKENSSSPRKIKSSVNVPEKVLSPFARQREERHRSREYQIKEYNESDKLSKRTSENLMKHRSENRKEKDNRKAYDSGTLHKRHKAELNATVDKSRREKRQEKRKDDVIYESKDTRKAPAKKDLSENISSVLTEDWEIEYETVIKCEEENNETHFPMEATDKCNDLKVQVEMMRKRKPSSEEGSENLVDLYGDISSLEGSSNLQDSSHVAYVFIDELLIENKDKSFDAGPSLFTNTAGIGMKAGESSTQESKTLCSATSHLTNGESGDSESELGRSTEQNLCEKGNVDKKERCQPSDDSTENINNNMGSDPQSDIHIHVSEQERLEFSSEENEENMCITLKKEHSKRRTENKERSKYSECHKSKKSLKEVGKGASSNGKVERERRSTNGFSESGIEKDEMKGHKNHRDNYSRERGHSRHHSCSKDKHKSTRSDEKRGHKDRRKSGERRREKEKAGSDVQVLQCSNQSKSTYLDYIHKIDKIEKVKEDRPNFGNAHQTDGVRPRILKLPISPVGCDPKKDDTETDNEQNKTAVSVDYDKITECEKSVGGVDSDVSFDSKVRNQVTENSPSIKSSKMQTRFVSAKGRTVLLVSESVESEPKEQSTDQKCKKKPRKPSDESLKSDADFLCQIKKKHKEEMSLNSINSKKAVSKESTVEVSGPGQNSSKAMEPVQDSAKGNRLRQESAKGAQPGQDSSSKATRTGLEGREGTQPGKNNRKGTQQGQDDTKGTHQGQDDTKRTFPGQESAKGIQSVQDSAKRTEPEKDSAKGAIPVQGDANGTHAGQDVSKGTEPGQNSSKVSSQELDCTKTANNGETKRKECRENKSKTCFDDIKPNSGGFELGGQEKNTVETDEHREQPDEGQTIAVLPSDSCEPLQMNKEACDIPESMETEGNSFVDNKIPSETEQLNNTSNDINIKNENSASTCHKDIDNAATCDKNISEHVKSVLPHQNVRKDDLQKSMESKSIKSDYYDKKRPVLSHQYASTTKQSTSCASPYWGSDSQSSDRLRIVTEDNSLSSLKEQTDSPLKKDLLVKDGAEEERRCFFHVSIEAIKNSIKEKIKSRNESMCLADSLASRGNQKDNYHWQNDSDVESKEAESDVSLQRNVVNVMEIAHDSSKCDTDMEMDSQGQLVSMDKILGDHIQNRISWEDFENERDRFYSNKTADIDVMNDGTENDVAREVFSETESITEFFDEQSQLELEVASSLRASDGIKVSRRSFESNEDCSKLNDSTFSLNDTKNSENDMESSKSKTPKRMGSSAIECVEISLMADTLSDAWAEKYTSEENGNADDQDTLCEKREESSSESEHESSLTDSDADQSESEEEEEEDPEEKSDEENHKQENEKSDGEKSDGDLEEGEISSDSDHNEQITQNSVIGCEKENQLSDAKTKTGWNSVNISDLRNKLNGNSARKQRERLSPRLRVRGSLSEQRSFSSSEMPERSRPEFSKGSRSDSKYHRSSEKNTGDRVKSRTMGENETDRRPRCAKESERDPSRRSSSSKRSISTSHRSQKDSHSSLERSEKRSNSTSGRSDRQSHSTSERSSRQPHMSTERMEKPTSERSDRKSYSKVEREVHSTSTKSACGNTERNNISDSSRHRNSASVDHVTKPSTPSSDKKRKRRDSLESSHHERKVRRAEGSEINTVKRAFSLVSKSSDSKKHSTKSNHGNIDGCKRKTDMSREDATLKTHRR